MLPQIVLAALSHTAGLSRQQQTGSVPDYPTAPAGNPFVSGWYADPDTEYYEGPILGLPDRVTYLDAFSSPDLVHWTKHPNILTIQDVKWATEAVWAPAPIARNGKYYLYFGANDIQENEDADGTKVGGIGVAVADRPEGPYVDAIGAPLIGHYYNGAQPIDQDVFIDDDGQAYIYYGGHSHANVAKINEDMISIGDLDDNNSGNGTATRYKEITPENYTEGSQMMKRNGTYYFMWSEGGWGGPDYSVSYAMADSPLGPFERKAKILQQDDAVATGSGHHGVIQVPDTEIYYIVYHRRPLSETDGNHRVLAYDRMYFNDDGTIAPVKMLVHDNFADGNAIGWKMYGDRIDNWTVAGQHLVGGCKDDGLAMLDTNFTDLVMNASVAVSNGTSERSDVGLVFRATNLGGGSGSSGSSFNGTAAAPAGPAVFNGYYAGISAAGYVVLGKYDSNGTMTTLGQASVARLQAATDYTMSVTAIGSGIKVYLGDTNDALITATDSTYTSGANGVAVHAAAGVFGDVSVDKPT
ncbi:glycoside hydrolase family 43 protein [Apiospora phragmitis]|uniref:Glycoside hydrolase family 43 protein n=1 Tax=Apiospora phragmitis TaxID=2905665 RepID=A0ABR1W713_9PEZI